MEGTESSHIPAPCPPHSLSHYRRPHQKGHSFQLMNLYWLILSPEVQLTLGLTLGAVHSVGLDKCIVRESAFMASHRAASLP